MQRKFLGNLFLLQVLNWLVKPVWIFWIERMAQINLGDEWYGKYFVVFNFGLLFNILLDFGLNNYISSTIAKGGDSSQIKPVIRLRALLALIYISLVAALGIWQGFDPWILGLVIINQFLAGTVLFLRAVLQGRHMFRTDSLVSVTDRAVAIILCAIFLISFQFAGRNGVLVFLAAQGIGYFISAGIAAYFAFRQQKIKHTSIQENNSIQKLVKQTAWFAILAFAMSVFTRIDAVMIRNLAPSGYSEAGLYAQGFRLLDAALIFSSLISVMLLPVFSKLISEKKSTDPMVWLNTRIVLFVAIPAALGAVYFGGDILQLLYKKSYANQAEFFHASETFIPLMCCFIPMALVHVFGTWLTAAHKVKYLAVLAFACMAINVAFNFVFIPEFGATGAGWSCLATQSVFAAGCIFYAKWNGAFAFQWNRSFRIFIWIIFSVFLFRSMPELMPGLTGFLAACAAFIPLTFICGIFWTEIRKFLGFVK